MFTAVQREGGRREGLIGIEALGDDVAGAAAQAQGFIDGFAHLLEGMLLQQPQHTDEFARAPGMALAFQAGAQQRKAFGKLPILERFGVVERAGFAFEQFKVMQGLEGDVLLVP